MIFCAKLQGRGEPEISPALTGGLSGPHNWLSRSGSGQLIFVSDVRETFDRSPRQCQQRKQPEACHTSVLCMSGIVLLA